MAANPFTTPNLYGNGPRQAPPFYPLFSPYAQTHPNSPFPQGIQYHPPQPPLLHNPSPSHFQTNTTPPIPLPQYGVPQPDPALLKQFGGHPFPFPPPPPGMLPPVFQGQQGQQQFRGYQSAVSQATGANSTPQTYQPGGRPAARKYKSPTPPPQPSKAFRMLMGEDDEENGTEDVEQDGKAEDGTTPIQSFDGASLSRILKAASDSAAVTNVAHSEINGLPLENAQPQKTSNSLSIESLREQAKQAILEMEQCKVTFQTYLEAKIDNTILKTLFAELGIDRAAVGSQAVKSSATDEMLTEELKFRDKIHDEIAAPQSESITTAGEPIRFDPAMERKDRIARLLAAKKASGPSSIRSSASASPIPQEAVEQKPFENSHSSLRNVIKPVVEASFEPATTVIAREPVSSAKTVQLLVPSSALVDQSAAESASAISLSTPVREELRRSGFTIPGLFMDDEVQDTAVSPAADQTTEQPDPVLDDGTTRPMSVEGAEAGPSAVQVNATTPPSIDSRPKSAGILLSTNQSKVNQGKLAERLAKLKADMLLKRNRGQTLQKGMPILDAEVNKSRRYLATQEERLQQLNIEIDNLQDNLDRSSRERETLKGKIDQLRAQIQEGEAGQQQFSDELARLDTQIKVSEAVQNRVAHVTPPLSILTTNANNYNGSTIQLPDLTSSNQAGQTSPKGVVATASAKKASQSIATSPVSETIEMDYSSDEGMLDGDEHQELLVKSGSQVSLTQDDQEHRQRLPSMSDGQNATDAEAVLNGEMNPEQSDANGDDELEDSDHMSVDSEGFDDLQSDGSASMSNDSDEYEPAEPEERAGDRLDDSASIEDHRRSSPTGEVDRSRIDLVTKDEYEPTEEVPMLDLNTLVSAENSFPTSPGNGSSEQNRPEIDQQDMRRANGIHVETTTPLNISAVSSEPTRPDGEAALPANEFLSVLPDGSSHYKPYKSALLGLKSYRFNPRFAETVPTSFRSLTYSNKIDPKKPLCPTEMNGEECNDPECEEQHTADMILDDSKILVQMSSAEGIKDKNKRDAYLAGLKKMIAGLRAKGIKEFTEVGTAIANYKREYVATHGWGGIVDDGHDREGST